MSAPSLPDAGDLDERFGPFEDLRLFELALTHRSHAFEAGGTPTNERLEFLGDAVLGLLVTERIFHLLPDAPEGRLAKIRSAAVNTHSLAEIARGLGVGSAVRLGRGEESTGGRDKDSILADTLEALIGAVYLDRGLGAAARLIGELFTPLLDELSLRRESLDYKTSLQELSAATFQTLPAYKVVEAGPDHAKWFTAEVSIAGEALGTGEGRSKKEAEQGAARVAYALLQQRLALSSADSGTGPGPTGEAEPRPGDDGGQG